MNVTFGRVATMLHHNTENMVHVSGFDQAQSYKRTITYFVSDDHLRAVKTATDFCEQSYYMYCNEASPFEEDLNVFSSLDRKYVSYRTSADPGCKCVFADSCTVNNKE